jgi:hypothetical protein
LLFQENFNIFTVIVCYTAVAAVTFLVTMASQESKINICLLRSRREYMETTKRKEKAVKTERKTAEQR